MISEAWLRRYREAGAYLSVGRFREALAIYQKITKIYPRASEVHCNMGVALRGAGLLKEAIRSYSKAIKIDPNYVIARRNLARALLHEGRVEEALEQFIYLLRNSKSEMVILGEIVEAVSNVKFGKPSNVARRLMLLLFNTNNVDYQRLALPAVQLILSGKKFSAIINSIKSSNLVSVPFSKLISEDMFDTLLISLLTWTIVPSIHFERWITIVRQKLLVALVNGENINLNQNGLWALVVQFQATEFVQSVSETESSLVKNLLGKNVSTDIKKLAVMAMYQPLRVINSNTAFWKTLHANASPTDCLRISIDREIFHPESEIKIEEEISKLTDIDDETSGKVRKQYEINPYPRWLSVEAGNSSDTLGGSLEQRFPNLDTTNLNLHEPDILIAGCGTGRHAISTANRYKGSKVMAIDLSCKSLAYSIRQAKGRGQTNLTFFQADILKLNGIRQRFDLIEASGVLHHMRDPFAGWKVLRGLLKPDGLMRIGLYSHTARRNWSKWREKVPNTFNKDETTTFVRERRKNILEHGETNGMEQTLYCTADFYTVSGCRDLLFHEREAQFSLTEIQKTLEKLDLKFLGFANISSDTMDEFNNQFGSGSDPLNLKQWSVFEDRHPETFLAMYQFWCQAVA